MAFENNVKRIDQREWKVVRDKWLSYIPDFDTPGAPPAHQILEFVGLDAIFKKTQITPGEFKQDVPFLRQEVLREAIFFLHKATHVCGAANIHLDNGALSWSISSAYQSSFFALKGILGLLGLSFPRINTALMIDCFPEEEKLSNKQRKRGEKPKPEFKFVVFPKLSHTHMWQIFQRVLNSSTVEIWKEEMILCLSKLHIDQFAQQRNSLHYVNNFWLFPGDLFNRMFDPAFGIDVDLFKNLDSDKLQKRSDFSFILNYIMLKFGIDLLKDLSENATAVKAEYDLIQITLTEGIHKRFLASVS